MNNSSSPRALTWPWVLGFFLLAMMCWGSRPLYDPDEGRYGEAAREFLHPVSLADLMTPDGTDWRIDLGKKNDALLKWGMLQVNGERDWLVPRLQGHPHLTKPPFTYWITALGMSIFGVNAWGARFFLSLAFFGTILCTVRLARLWGWSVVEAHAAGLMYGTAVLPFAAGHILTTDTFLVFWETLGILACWQAWLAGPRANPWRWVFWAAFGFAFLTKGPPGWLPLAVIGAFAWLRRRDWKFSGRLFSWAGLVLMLLIAFTWFVLVCRRQPLLWKYFLGYEFIDRIATSEHKRDNLFFMYPPTLFIGLLPWAALWPGQFQKVREKLRRPWRTWSDAGQFSALWLLIMFVVFTLAQSRMFLYVLPLCVPLTIWTARTWVQFCGGSLWPKTGRRKHWVNAIATVWVLAMLAFLNIPAESPLSRTQKVMAEQWLKFDPDGRYQLFSEDDTVHSLSFYAGRRCIELDRKSKAQLQILAKETQAGRPSALIVGKNRLKKYEGRGPFQKVADWKNDVIITPAP